MIASGCPSPMVIGPTVQERDGEVLVIVNGRAIRDDLCARLLP